MLHSTDEKLTRYQALIQREDTGRPMFGLLWEPTVGPHPAFVEKIGAGTILEPHHIDPEMFMPYIEEYYQKAQGWKQDTIQPFCMSWGMPWLEAIAGAPLSVEPGGIWAGPTVKSYDSRKPIEFDPDNNWLRKLLECYEALSLHSGGRFPVALPTMRCPLDSLAALRGPAEMCLDFYDHPDEVHRVLGELAELYIKVNEAVLDVILPFENGHSTRMHLWAPGKAITPQNDISTIVSTRTYEEFALPWDRKIIERFDYHSYHLHAPEHHIYEILADIEPLTALQVTLDFTPGDFGLEDMIPILRRVLSKKPIILVCLDFEQAERCLEALPGAGLCLMLAPQFTTDPDDVGHIRPEYIEWLEKHCQ
ncbi:MAG: hypothetical protein H8E35_15815 [Ardenticatenia bacterium]|nr:hypothetical protein [Ardenticatenia bacterium]